MGTGVWVVLGVVAVIAICVIGYYIARFMKGSMKLELNQGSVSSGEQITGAITIKVKKDVFADRIFVALIGEREERTRSSNGNSSKRWREFYRDEVDVLMDQELLPGIENRYDVVIDAPSQDQVMTGAQAISSIADNMDDGIAKSVAVGIGSVAGGMGSMIGGRKRWKVISRLDMKGVDLAASKKIHVSVK